MATIFKYSVKFIGVSVLLYLVFLIFLIIVSTITSSALQNNIGQSVAILKKEGSYPSFGVPIRQIVLDNYTDALMLNTAYSVDSSNAFRSALVNSRYDGRTDSANQITNLEKLYNHQNVQRIGYERYWHGYLLYLRPLLTVFSYSGIRVILTLLLYAACGLFMYLSWKRLGMVMTLAMLIALIAVDFFYLGQSMQFSGVFLIGLGGSMYLLTQNQKNINIYLLMFIIGALTSFVDLLTAPLISLGLLLVTAEALEKSSLKKLFIYCISWSVGYLLLWYSKWKTVELLFIPGAVKIAFNEITDRTVNKADANFSHFNAIKLNFFQLIGYNKIDKIIVLCLLIICVLFVLRYFRFNSQKIKSIIPWIFIAIVPYVWYFIAANHSYLHVWYTYRDQFMTVVSFIAICSLVVNWEHVKKDMAFFRTLGRSKSTVEKRNH